MARRRQGRITEQFVARVIPMLESYAYRVLSQSAYRVLSRIEIELAHHGGNDNGRLPVTYDDFQAYGIDRHSIRPAIDEVVALGFVEIMRPGRAGNAEFRRPTLYRLTYVVTKSLDPTHEWKRIETRAQALTAAKRARQKNKNPVGISPASGEETPHRKHGGISPTTCHGGKSPTTLDISGRGATD